MSSSRVSGVIWAVALLAEGVDRNLMNTERQASMRWSPSSRRAWIEIVFRRKTFGPSSRRPPRGGRG